MYSKETIDLINSEFEGLERKYRSIMTRIVSLSQYEILTQPQALKYATEGAGRRLKLVYKCIRNIFKIYPPERTSLLAEAELEEICINLHAFYMNAFGTLDNLAWIIAHERRISNNVRRNDVGLYSDRFRKHLTPEFDAHLQSFTSWHGDFLKDYRDALAHRIPLYVPPYTVPTDDPEMQSFDLARKQNSIFFLQCADETPNPMKMHPQLLADFNTLENILRHFCHYEFPLAETLTSFLDSNTLTVTPPDEIKPYLSKWVAKQPPEVQALLTALRLD